MGCPAFGVWVAFLKQPALPGQAKPPMLDIPALHWIDSKKELIGGHFI
jgi:hypothetical protein